MHTALTVAQVIFGIILIAVVLIQPGKTDGLNFISGGASDTFFSKNKSRTHEALQVRITIVCAIIFAVTTVLLNIME